MIKHNLRGRRLQHGFTIVELAVVIGLMGILATVGVMSYIQVQRQSRDGQRQSDMITLQNELEKYYDSNGVYPPGCPSATCSTWFLTENTASPILNAATPIATIQTTLPGISAKFGDPSAASNANPIMDVASTAPEYFYYGGTVNYRATGSSASYGGTTLFPCSIKSSLNPGTVGSYVIGYFSEANQAWVLWGGKHGVPMSVASGGCNINT